MGPLGGTAAALAAAGTACVAYGALVERRWYRLRSVPVDGVLRRTAGRALRILHVSDVHLDPPQRHRTEFLARVAEEDYDLVVATGDLLGAVGAEDACVEALAPLTAGARPGLVVLGSNDLFGPSFKNPLHYFTTPDRRVFGTRLDTRRLVAGLTSTGWTTLRGAVTSVRTGAGVIEVGGIDDPHLPKARLPDADQVRPPGSADAVLRLGLVHSPYQAALDLLTGVGYDLILAGHTHGGQVRFPPIGAVTDNCDLPLDQARGVSRWGPAWLHVSPGLGTSRYAPFRFACRPEATILTLTA